MRVDLIMNGETNPYCDKFKFFLDKPLLLMYNIKMLADIFTHTFLLRAVIVGLLTALCAALLGISLVLKRYSMIGDGLSHVGFGTVAIAAVMNLNPLVFSLPIVVLSAFLLLRISENSKLKGDAAIAFISSGSLAVGVTVISVVKGVNIDIGSFMFGSIFSVTKNDMIICIILAVTVLLIYLLYYNPLFAVTFDENFSRATGLKVERFNMLLAALTAVMVVLGMRMMGALLISSLLIFPPLTAMRVCKNFKSVTVFSAAVSLISFIIGFCASYLYGTPAGGSIVIVNIIAFGLCSLIATIKVSRR